MLTRDNGEYLQVSGLNTFYLRKGCGTPLVLIHGASPGACALVNWGRNIEPLAARGLSVIAFDQPGFGYTANPPDASMEFRVAHAKSFIHALKLDRFHVLGNSQGAYIAARIALEEPGIQKLVLVSSGTLAPKGSPEAEALSREHAQRLRGYRPSLENCRTLTQNTLFKPDSVTAELVQLRYEMSIGKNLQAQAERSRAAAGKPIGDALRALKAKTLIFWGNNDRGAALERGVALFQQIPGAELHVFDQCGHWVQWDQTERFHAIVGDFLAR